MFITLMFIIISLSGCGEMIDGAGHVVYGLSTFMLGLFKVIGIIILVIIVIGIVVSIIKAIFE